MVKGTSLKAYAGEILAILGGNGTGKSTLLNLISGLNKPYRGKVIINGSEINTIPESKKYDGLLGVLPQNPQTLFVKKTVRKDLYEMFKGQKLSKEAQTSSIQRIIHLCDVSHLMDRHPYDLSGGEQQRVALAKILLQEPQILLLDEPTKGMDAEFKITFANILRHLMAQGVTVIMISHDVEFCATYADYCALFFDGAIVADGETREFFAGNNFYTTAANRMSRHILKDAITPNDVIEACGGTKIDGINESSFDDNITYEPDVIIDAIASPIQKQTLNIKKRIIAIISFIVLAWTSWKSYPLIAGFTWNQFTHNDNLATVTGEGWGEYITLAVLFVLASITFISSVFQKNDPKKHEIMQMPVSKRKLDHRTKVAAVLILLLIPLTIFIGVYYLGDRKYYFISLLIMLQTMLPFALVFEGRKPEARELVIIAVLCALAVTGRAVFFMLPQFKPVAAVVIIAGIALGGESGFLVGATTMLLSNMLYSQGPWTPWQMFAMGIIGFLAGLCFRKGFLVRNRVALSIFGGIAVFVIYGVIMNVASVVMYQTNITWPMIMASLITGLPFDLIHAISTSFFLFIIGEPMLEKLDRIKVKYGLIESFA